MLRSFVVLKFILFRSVQCVSIQIRLDCFNFWVQYTHVYTPEWLCQKDDEPVDFVGISFFKVAMEKAIGTHSEYQQSQMFIKPILFFLFGVWSIAISSRDPMKDEHPSRWPYGFVGKTLEEPRDFFAARSEIQRTADASKSRCGIWGERRCGDGPLSSGFHHWRATNLKTPPPEFERQNPVFPLFSLNHPGPTPLKDLPAYHWPPCSPSQVTVVLPVFQRSVPELLGVLGVLIHSAAIMGLGNS